VSDREIERVHARESAHVPARHPCPVQPWGSAPGAGVARGLGGRAGLDTEGQCCALVQSFLSDGCIDGNPETQQRSRRAYSSRWSENVLI
jgi:hypothetical protein